VVIPVELLKTGGVASWPQFSTVWETCENPTDWRKGIIIPIFKGKSDRRDCGGYRGVMLLSAPGKLFARVILDSEEY
jgi:hypothetical protein